MRLRTFATVAVTIAALTACGGGGGEEADPIAGATTSAPTEPTASETTDDAKQPAGEERTYVVKKGDTLSGIAARFKTTVRAIVRLNKLKDQHSLSIGQKLKIPAAG